MKLYLAGPMRGYKDLNRDAFKDARERLRDMKHEIFCPSEMTDTVRENGRPSDTRDMLWYDFAWILQEAEGMVCLPGWEKSKGALAEVHLAWAIGIPVYEFNLFVRRVIREVKIVPDNAGS